MLSSIHVSHYQGLAIVKKKKEKRVAKYVDELVLKVKLIKEWKWESIGKRKRNHSNVA